MNYILLTIFLVLINSTNIYSQNQSTIISEEICSKTNKTNRIISIGGSITEILYELDFEANIVAVDITSNYPKQAKKLPSVGYIRNLSSEGVLSMHPSLIISENDIGPQIIIEQLKKKQNWSKNYWRRTINSRYN